MLSLQNKKRKIKTNSKGKKTSLWKGYEKFLKFRNLIYLFLILYFLHYIANFLYFISTPSMLGCDCEEPKMFVREFNYFLGKIEDFKFVGYCDVFCEYDW